MAEQEHRPDAAGAPRDELLTAPRAAEPAAASAEADTQLNRETENL